MVELGFRAVLKGSGRGFIGSVGGAVSLGRELVQYLLTYVLLVYTIRLDRYTFLDKYTFIGHDVHIIEYLETIPADTHIYHNMCVNHAAVNVEQLIFNRHPKDPKRHQIHNQMNTSRKCHIIQLMIMKQC